MATSFAKLVGYTPSQITKVNIMFSGIVQTVGCIEDITQSVYSDLAIRICVDKKDFLDNVVTSGSIACAGVCFTVVDKNNNSFLVNASQATLSTTTVAQWILGDKVNLELACRVGQPLDGHIVQGHVDGVGRVEDISTTLGSHILKISYASALSRYMPIKGSVAIDGVSLTINETTDSTVTVNIIPYTWANTTFQYLKVYDSVNIETDLIARYLEALANRNAPDSA